VAFLVFKLAIQSGAPNLFKFKGLLRKKGFSLSQQAFEEYYGINNFLKR
jgi:hypothetical protein